MKIGFIGLGTMGRHMAMHLIEAGHELTVHDLRREAAEPHLAAGARWADSPAELAGDVELVFTSLPGPAEVETVALGEKGLLAGMRPGSVWFDLTTNSPALIRRLHALFAERGVHVLDAPVSGGPRGAQTRRLALWVGGDEELFRALQARAGRHRRPAVLRRPDRHRIGGQAGA
jgi:3-hydroxyisobutyrate dehydrogenase